MTNPEPSRDTLSLMLDEIRLAGASLGDIALVDDGVHAFAASDRMAVHIGQAGTVRIDLPGLPPQTLAAGDLLVVTVGGEHRLSRVAPGGQACVLTSGTFRYDAAFAAPMMAALPAVMRFSGSGADAPLWLLTGLAFLQQERLLPRPAAQAVINRVLDILMIECLRDQIERLPPDAGNWLAALRDGGLSAVLAAMHADPLHDWNVGELAEIAHASRSAFATRFARALGSPPMAYLSALRLRIAMRHLQQSSRPIKSIAAMLGYESTVGFTQAFKKQFGVPPSAVRDAGVQ